MTRAIVFVVFNDFQLLDLAGPMTVFEIASRFVTDAYTVETRAPEGGAVAASSGLSVVAAPAGTSDCDTLVVVGGNGTRAAVAASATLWLVQRLAATARRVTSVCSGKPSAGGGRAARWPHRDNALASRR